MALTTRDVARVRLVTHPVVQERDPMYLVDRGVDWIVDQRPLDVAPEEYLLTLRRAVADEEPITSRITFQNMPEEAVRAFLREVIAGLEKRIGGERPAGSIRSEE